MHSSDIDWIEVSQNVTGEASIKSPTVELRESYMKEVAGLILYVVTRLPFQTKAPRRMVSELFRFLFLACTFTSVYGTKLCLSQSFEMKESRENNRITEFALWSRSGIGTSAGCARDCARDIQCVSFFYNTRTDMCTAHGVRFFETSPMVSGVTDMGSLYYTRPVLTRDCADILNNNPNAPDGVYVINPHDGKGPLRVYCDMSTDGGGWTVFQRRREMSNFNRNWTEYAFGFGDITKDFWLGNDAINRLTVWLCELRVDMLDLLDAKRYAKYANFSVANETDNYRLLVAGFTAGNSGDELSYNDGSMFSTPDSDHDAASDWNCALDRESGFWYRHCANANLNGAVNIIANWRSYELKMVEMKLKIY